MGLHGVCRFNGRFVHGPHGKILCLFFKAKTMICEMGF